MTEKQAVVALARERTLEEDVLIATIQAVFAASKSLCITFCGFPSAWDLDTDYHLSYSCSGSAWMYCHVNFIASAL